LPACRHEMVIPKPILSALFSFILLNYTFCLWNLVKFWFFA